MSSSAALSLPAILATPGDSADPDLDKCLKHGNPLSRGICFHCIDHSELTHWVGLGTVGNTGSSDQTLLELGDSQPVSPTATMIFPFNGVPFFTHGAGPQPTLAEEGDQANDHRE